MSRLDSVVLGEVVGAAEEGGKLRIALAGDLGQLQKAERMIGQRAAVLPADLLERLEQHFDTALEALNELLSKRADEAVARGRDADLDMVRLRVRASQAELERDEALAEAKRLQDEIRSLQGRA